MKKLFRCMSSCLLSLFVLIPFLTVFAASGQDRIVKEEPPAPIKQDPEGHLYEMNYYSDGFFGYGEEGDFRQWSLAHFIPIALTGIMIFMIYKYRSAISSSPQEENIRVGIAVLMILFEMSYFWRLLYTGPGGEDYHNMLSYLPLQVCQWTLLLTSLMIVRKSKSQFSACFFLTHTLGLLPLLVPAVISRTGPAYYRYYQFWGEHLLPITAVYYMLFVHRMEVKPQGIIGAVSLLGLLSIPAIYVNQMVPSANYLYLKPEGVMLDFLPRNEWIVGSLYLMIMVILSAVVYGIYRFLSSRSKSAV
ncbi:MAG: TIGR02206 family membrane protein [Solobacterium sp.]|nr:TIGR02206 family membrane protein [Solobacterium sp.]